jgi:hypothetical protein
MRFNYFDSMIIGAISNGQAITNAVEGTHRTTLRELVIKFARRLSLRLGDWRGLKRTPTRMAPAIAMCPSYSASRWQRHQRFVSVVVVGDSGTVGVS